MVTAVPPENHIPAVHPNMLLLAVLFFSIIPWASSQFFTPTQSRESWRIGETKKISYNTKFTKYTIALWQQALAGGAANLGPVIFQTDEGPVKDFEWDVQTYDFDLASSNVFFLWLFEGDASVQGNQSAPQMSSAFFGITDQPVPSISAVPNPVTTTESSKTTQMSTAQPPLQTSAGPQSTQGTTGVDGSTDTNPTTRPNGSNDSSNSGSSGGLSVGAQAGIGVGVGIVAITSVVCGIMWCRYMRKKQKALEEWQSVALSQHHGSPAYHHELTLAHHAPQPYPESKVNYRQTGPVELG
ncbi:ser-thr- gpi-anchored family protein [Colletotrichum incanum]|uniref:Ser-thr-gpi-anchored family protein n=1 Tax=Colletotrichum incanum TaxID=1573173 RepID=A0A162NPX9_COLIC|nr:ser-thr- gpi-anchored family protein [Colletotrichum incanum]